MHSWNCSFLHGTLLISCRCAAKPRSRHRAMRMNVAKQKSKCMIRKCTTIPWLAAEGRKKEAKMSQNEPKGSQIGCKGEPKGYQNGAKMVPKWKRHLPKHPLRNRIEQIEKKGAKRMPIYANREPQLLLATIGFIIFHTNYEIMNFHMFPELMWKLWFSEFL